MDPRHGRKADAEYGASTARSRARICAGEIGPTTDVPAGPWLPPRTFFFFAFAKRPSSTAGRAPTGLVARGRRLGGRRRFGNSFTIVAHKRREVRGVAERPPGGSATASGPDARIPGAAVAHPAAWARSSYILMGRNAC